MSDNNMICEHGIEDPQRNGRADCCPFCRIAALEAEVARLREFVKGVASHREDCHAYDDDMGHERRYFSDDEEWDRLEKQAEDALSKGNG